MDSFVRTVFVFSVCSALLAQAPAPKRPTPATPAAPIDPKPATPAAGAPAAPSASRDRVVITIGEEKITAAQFEELIENLPEQYRAMARGAARRQFLDQIINMKGLAGEARKRKLDQSPAFKRQLTFQEDNVLAALLYQDLASNAKVDDAALRQHFDQHKNEYEQCRARHILVRTKDSPMPQIPGQSELTDEQAKEKAAALKKRITGGEDFAAVAKAESDDATTRPSGGDLGQFRRGSMVPPFDQAAFSLPVKEISDPVRTPYGYHLIQVESRESKTFDEVKPEIEKKIRPERAKQAVDDIRKGIKVEVDDAYFGPARQ